MIRQENFQNGSYSRNLICLLLSGFLVTCLSGCSSGSFLGFKKASEITVALGPVIPAPVSQEKGEAPFFNEPEANGAHLHEGVQSMLGVSALEHAWVMDDTERFQAAVFLALEYGLFPDEVSMDLVVWEEPVTRGEFALWLMGFSGETSSSHLLRTFEDVEPTHIYYTAIEDVVERGWMRGLLDGQSHRFYPEQPLTREELAQTLVVWGRMLQTISPDAQQVDGLDDRSGELIKVNSVSINGLPDEKAIGVAYRPYVDAAVQATWFSDLFQQHLDDLTTQGFSPKQAVSKDMALMALYGLSHPPIAVVNSVSEVAVGQ